jgi:hypothetical protein
MAIYRKDPQTGTILPEKPSKNASSGLGRGLTSLSSDNAPKEKKPLVVRRGAADPATVRRSGMPVQTNAPKKTAEAAGVGGRVVIRSGSLPATPLCSDRNARKGTTVLIRTERDDPPKRYRVNERIVLRDPTRNPDRPIVINPRKKR